MAEANIITLNSVLIWTAVSAILFGILQTTNTFSNPRISGIVSIVLGLLAAFFSSTFSQLFEVFSNWIVFLIIIFFFIILLTKFIGVENFATTLGGNKTGIWVVLVPIIIILMLILPQFIHSDSEEEQVTISDDTELDSDSFQDVSNTRIGSEQEKTGISAIFTASTLGILLLFIIAALMIAFFVS